MRRAAVTYFNNWRFTEFEPTFGFWQRILRDCDPAGNSGGEMPDADQHGNVDLTRLLQNCRSWLRSVIVARLGSTDGADDVLQEVHVAAIEQKSPIREPAAFRSWLFQVAVRQTLLFRRKTGRYRRLIKSTKEKTAVPESDDENPLAWLLCSERRVLVREALRQLQDREREFLVLKYVENWSYRKIAEHCGSTERAVESRVHRARANLRNQLRKRNVIDPETKINGEL